MPIVADVAMGNLLLTNCTVPIAVPPSSCSSQPAQIVLTAPVEVVSSAVVGVAAGVVMNNLLSAYYSLVMNVVPPLPSCSSQLAPIVLIDGYGWRSAETRGTCIWFA